ncbi:MAG: hypothetical protein ACTSR8_13380 [Promethearchaeota archaeon]
MNPVEVYIIAKDAGILLYKYSILDFGETDKDQLMSGFLTALNNFVKELDFPEGVSLIRSGSIEARFSAGEHIFSVLIIDYQMPLGSSTEPILSGLAEDITKCFEQKYPSLSEQIETGQYEPDSFQDFREEIDQIIDQYGVESYELYQKLVLIEALYAKVPQKWCLPMIEQLGQGQEKVDIVKGIPKNYHPQLKKAIRKVNLDSLPVWEIFAVSIIDPNILK